MKKESLESLTAEDWGNLFPIKISPYNPKWPILFKEEQELIRNALFYLTNLQVAHFGSTAVPGLQAKDTIDILVEIPNSELFSKSPSFHKSVLPAS